MSEQEKSNEVSVARDALFAKRLELKMGVNLNVAETKALQAAIQDLEDELHALLGVPPLVRA